MQRRNALKEKIFLQEERHAVFSMAEFSLWGPRKHGGVRVTAKWSDTRIECDRGVLMTT